VFSLGYFFIIKPPSSGLGEVGSALMVKLITTEHFILQFNYAGVAALAVRPIASAYFK
jgi:hypothetical protein